MVRETVLFLVLLIVSCQSFDQQKVDSFLDERSAEAEHGIARLKETLDKRYQELDRIRSECQEKCKNGATEFCRSFVSADLDYNGLTSDFIMTIDFINGYCEDRIPCAAVVSCDGLDLEKCRTIVCNSFAGMEEDKIMKAFGEAKYLTYNGILNPGKCYNKIKDINEFKQHWFTKLLTTEDIMFGLEESCIMHSGTCYATKDEIQNAYRGNWEESCVPVQEFFS